MASITSNINVNTLEYYNDFEIWRIDLKNREGSISLVLRSKAREAILWAGSGDPGPFSRKTKNENEPPRNIVISQK